MVPAVILGLAGDNFPIPVVDRAYGTQLTAHILNIADGPFIGMNATADRRVLSGQAKSVEPDWMEHVVALHLPEPCVGVRRGQGVPMPDVEVA